MIGVEEEFLEIEVLDGELVPAEGAVAELYVERERSPVRQAPAVQTAVAAATGFVAGAATMALLGRYGRRALLEASERDRAVPVARRRPTTYIVSIRPLVPPE